MWIVRRIWSPVAREWWAELLYPYSLIKWEVAMNWVFPSTFFGASFGPPVFFRQAHMWPIWSICSTERWVPTPAIERMTWHHATSIFFMVKPMVKTKDSQMFPVEMIRISIHWMNCQSNIAAMALRTALEFPGQKEQQICFRLCLGPRVTATVA